MNGISKCYIENETDIDGNPAGGSVKGIGLSIEWQNGPLGRGAERKEPNGAFVETVISAAVSRIEYYQASKYNCADNAEALVYLAKALECLERRTKEREARQVEGEHKA